MPYFVPLILSVDRYPKPKITPDEAGLLYHYLTQQATSNTGSKVFM